MAAAVTVFLRLPLDLPPTRRPTPARAVATAATPSAVRAMAPTGPERPAERAPALRRQPTVAREALPRLDAPVDASGYHAAPPSALRLPRAWTCVRRGQPLPCQTRPAGRPGLRGTAGAPGPLDADGAPALLDTLGAAPAETLSLLAARQHALGDFDRAADLYEAVGWHADGAAEAPCPGCASPHEALEAAILLRQSLGQRDRALQAAARYDELYRRRRPGDAARIGMHAARLEATPEDAAARYEALLSTHGEHVTPSLAIQARVSLGRARWASADPRAAARAFADADRLWRRAGGSQMAAPTDVDASQWPAELGRTRDAVAEARFHLAERRRERFAAVTAPRYDGPATADELERFLQRELRPWLARKTRALRGAERAYARVLSLGASRWAVAAQARAAQLYGQLDDDFRAVRLPERVTVEDERISEIPVDDVASRRLSSPAIARFEGCVSTAHRTRQYDAFARSCIESLERLAPERHAPLVELRPDRPHLRDELAPPPPRL